MFCMLRSVGDFIEEPFIVCWFMMRFFGMKYSFNSEPAALWLIDAPNAERPVCSVIGR